MPESDVTKMKVADLKRELKLRGLAITGNKTELQDRLQAALIDGDISLEDTAISSEDALLDDDAVLTDEDEEKILGADENELLKSPVSTPTVPDVTPLVTKAGTDSVSPNVATVSASESSPALAAPKKIVLKRKGSLTMSSLTNTADEVEVAATNAPKEKILKMSERNPITIGDIDKTTTSTTAANNGESGKKLTQLSQKERLEMRAKKFGVNTNTASNSISAPTNKIISGATGPTSSDPKQIEMLKKRAERFGCVVSSKMAKIDAEEKLLKRKERFGGSDGKNNSTSMDSNVWAEKARARLERFKTTSTVAPVSTKISITTGGADTETTSATTTTSPTAVASN